MEQGNLKVLRLHEHPQYLKPCCELINDEWPRSETARMMSLQASCNNLPTSLILINDAKHLLGHCKLTAIPSIPESCFIETVVISKVMRGRKLGSYLMRQVEEYCTDVLKLKMLHLSTKGQEAFYAKLGYKECPPVSIYGTGITYNTPQCVSNKIQNSVPENNYTQAGPQPPPPPPMPKPDRLAMNNTITSTKTYMFKYL
ncbi:N-alpha-acetyltransferase 80 isoform X1 [Trichoplusia ni]|uniref:N-alpha-acetyltransferase 80 isoform X1 n=1 Tax=Trichoplusia ni TaxID=7111 RepID=A0A7E5WSE2_TRINI|nr:N-alpha-acetyltransferase 80 isoform X1 [Trichoplusia ni]